MISGHVMHLIINHLINFRNDIVFKIENPCKIAYQIETSLQEFASQSLSHPESARAGRAPSRSLQGSFKRIYIYSSIPETGNRKTKKKTTKDKQQNAKVRYRYLGAELCSARALKLHQCHMCKVLIGNKKTLLYLCSSFTWHYL